MSEETLILNQILDKANQAFMNNYLTYTNFLTLFEQSIFLENRKKLPNNNFFLSGGYEESERKIIFFYPDYLDKTNFFNSITNLPIDIITIEPANKFYNQKLKHRDFLGSILNLGIQRNKIGDIIVHENKAHVFCLNPISIFISENLLKVRNSNVLVKIEKNTDLINFSLKYSIIKGTVSSLRIDNIIKIGFSLSRDNAKNYINSSKVFVNSKLVEKSSQLVKLNDFISIRGLGKIRLANIGNLTKKGRIYVEINKY